MNVTFTAAADVFGGLAQKAAPNVPKFASFDDPIDQDDEEDAPENEADSNETASESRSFSF